MERFSRQLEGDVIQLSGVRWGESDGRDSKLRLRGCVAGGECGLPSPGERVTAPIISWRTCRVIEWLDGETGSEVTDVIGDLLPLMREVVQVYEVRRSAPGLLPNLTPPITASRFGCVGCPAITNEKVTKSRLGREHPEWAALRRIYDIWDAFYNYKNRCYRIKNGVERSGPLRMAVRQKYLPVLLEIQRDAGIVLVNDEDLAFIHDCWERKAYPRGWSEADEATLPLPRGGLLSS